MHPAGHQQPTALRRELAAIARLALPVALAQFGLMSLGMVDVIMVGHLSPLALAAVSLGHTYSLGIMILGLGMLFALDPLVSQAHGARDSRRVADAMHRGIVLALVLSLVFGLLFVFGEPLLAFLSRQPEVVPTAQAYIRVIALSLPAYFLFIVFRQTLQAMSIVRPVMIAVVVANLANVVLNLGFVYGYFGFPRLEVVGSAWASTCCRYLMMLIVILAGSTALKRVWHAPRASVLRLRSYLPMLTHGIQIGIQISLEVWLFMTVSFLMMRMGVVEMGGHIVALNLASAAFMIPLGLGAAAATRVGNAIGAGNPAGARRSAQAALMLGVGVMLISAALFLGLPGPLARLYTDDPAVLQMALLLLPIAGLFQVFDGTQAVACGVLRGAGQTRAPALINLFGYWILGLPAGLYLSDHLGWGPAGLWWGLVVGLSACSLLLVIQVYRSIGRTAPADRATVRSR